MDLLRLLVKAGPNSDLRRLLFSNFSALLSFLKVDTARPPAAAPAASEQPLDAGGGGGSGGGRRLYFAGPVARLMGAVVEGDAALVTSVSDEHLTQLARVAARSRYPRILFCVHKKGRRHNLLKSKKQNEEATVERRPKWYTGSGGGAYVLFFTTNTHT